MTDDKGDLERIVAAQRENLSLLERSGVALAIGSDSWADHSHGEVRYLRELGVFSDLELLEMWTRTCAETVFPARRIGQLKDGFEASFLVLEASPLDDFANTRRIRLRVKEGLVLAGRASSG